MIDERRLVDWATAAVSIPSFTGSEQALAEWIAGELRGLGLDATLQQVEEGRANVLATRAGSGGGSTLMFNGHLDTSYSGREPWSQGVEGFQPVGVERDGRIWGLGISNMKGALACYLAAVAALRDEALRGDVVVAAVCGEIEKTQYGDAQGAEYRGYAAGTRHLVTHGGVADMCLLGEPTEGKVVLGHFGSLWARIGVGGDFVHTAFSEGRANSVLRMAELLEPIREWCERWAADPANAYRGVPAIASVGAVRGGYEWRLSRTPQRTSAFLDVRVPPTRQMAEARRAVLDLVRDLRSQHPDWDLDAEVYVTAPGAEIDEAHELVGAVDAAHEEVFGAPPGRDVPRWFSDASALTAYGIPTLNYGASTGLMEPGKGESLEVESLVKTAEVYARVARRICGAAA
ncbi:MAG TPA: M20/M25/M40 family metallo-hydrolase [Gaiellaceae bacterium]|nr:M20/M25/M40 family metallo-hydrolase [Gaiellaceae bacterium]